MLNGLQPGDEIIEINRKPVFVHCKDPDFDAFNEAGEIDQFGRKVKKIEETDKR